MGTPDSEQPGVKATHADEGEMSRSFVQQCTGHLRSWLSGRFPLGNEFKRYNTGKFRLDFLAAGTVALVSIPQAIGFSLIAGLPVLMVLMSVIVGGFVAALFTSSHQLVFGPSNSMSILIAATVASFASYGLGAPELALMLALLIGIIQVISGLAKLGKLTQFISRSVIIGYSTAIGLLLAVSQLGNWIGASAGGHGVFHQLWSFVQHGVHLTFNPYSLMIGVTTLLLFHIIEKLWPKLPAELIGLVLFALLARYMRLDLLGVSLMRDEGALAAAIPTFTGIPVDLSHMSLVAPFLSTALAIAILGMLEATSLGKALASKSGQRIDSNQEIMSLGMGNLANSFFGGMPGSASFARSAANLGAGATSQFSAIMSSLLVLGALYMVTPVINFMPIPCLAAHLIRIGLKMVHRDEIRVAWRSTGSDRIAFLVTLLSAFFLKLDIAIYVGVGLSLVLFLRKASAPSLVEYAFNQHGQLSQVEEGEERGNPAISIVHVEGELFFGAADLFQDQVRFLASDPQIRVIVLRMKNARHLDATSVMSLLQLLAYLNKNKRHLIMSGISPDVEKVLRASGAYDQIGAENIFPAEVNLTMATKRALLRASHLLQQDGGSGKADVRIYYDEKRQESAKGSAGMDESTKSGDYQI